MPPALQSPSQSQTTVRAQQMARLFLHEQCQQETLTLWTLSWAPDQNSAEITLIPKSVVKLCLFDKANKDLLFCPNLLTKPDTDTPVSHSLSHYWLAKIGTVCHDWLAEIRTLCPPETCQLQRKHFLFRYLTETSPTCKTSPTVSPQCATCSFFSMRV